MLKTHYGSMSRSIFYLSILIISYVMFAEKYPHKLAFIVWKYI